MRILPVIAALALPLAAAACAPTAGPRPAAPERTAPLSTGAAHGLAFAQARCSGCHAVTALAVSPNPEAPPFEAIVATPALTRDTLRTFLRDSHNFPATMNFAISSGEIDDLADYMLTLRDSG